MHRKSLFTYGLFNDTANLSDYTVPSNRAVNK
jgi:hypothetical protein